MQWLLTEFGCDTFRKISVVLPTDDFFPDEYYGEEEDVEALVEVCG